MVTSHTGSCIADAPNKYILNMDVIVGIAKISIRRRCFSILGRNLMLYNNQRWSQSKFSDTGKSLGFLVSDSKADKNERLVSDGLFIAAITGTCTASQHSING